MPAELPYLKTTLTPQMHHALRPMLREDFGLEDSVGLQRCLRRDPFQRTMADVLRWLKEEEQTLWVTEGEEWRLGLLLERAVPSSLCLTYIWGRGLRQGAPQVLLGMERLAKQWGLRWLTATFATERLLRVFQGAKVAYIYGMYEVK